MAFESDSFGVHGFVGLEVIESAACAPRPGAQRSPIIQLARLSFVAQADDALFEACAIVSLHSGRNDRGVTPTSGQDLLLPGRTDGSGRTRLLALRILLLKLLLAFCDCGQELR